MVSGEVSTKTALGFYSVGGLVSILGLNEITWLYAGFFSLFAISLCLTMMGV